MPTVCQRGAAEIGELLGVSRMQVSRIIRQTIDHLRHVADGHAERAKVAA